MFTPIAAFGGVSVNDLDKAKQFYGQTLGFAIEERFGGFSVMVPNNELWVYIKPDHQPATYTTFNFIVSNIDEAVDALAANGVTFEHYGMPYQDEKGIARGKDSDKGPNIAWFKDPAGNILAVLEN